MLFFFLGQAYTVVIKPKEEVGKVVLLRLRLEARPGFPDLDWHCQALQVRRSSEDPEVEIFPCHKWIQTADGCVELRNEKSELFLFYRSCTLVYYVIISLFPGLHIKMS